MKRRGRHPPTPEEAEGPVAQDRSPSRLVTGR
jgi:hypothetical protein